MERARASIDCMLAQDLTAKMLIKVAEARDNDSANHLARTQAYVDALVRHLPRHQRFDEHLTEARLDVLVKAVPLHDLGKIDVPDAVLRKPGRLDPVEIGVMRLHTTLGAKALDDVILQTGAANGQEQLLGPCSLLRVAREIALYHHERWDGTGYPERLAGTAIPVSARLMALADVFDALTTERVYKSAMTLEQAARTIEGAAGSIFDPELVTAFLASKADFSAIFKRHFDSP
ncbi:MAG: HD domain-containing phosphohydrolase [Spirochaetota bacterium]